MSKIVNISVKDENLKWWEKFDEMKWREKKSLSTLVQEACEEYYKNHSGTQNPQNTLDLHIKNPDALSMPAIVRANLDDFKAFLNDINDNQAQDLLHNLQSFTGFAETRVKYGNSLKRVF